MSYKADIAENLERIRDRIRSATERIGRDTQEVKLVAVTKSVEPSRIKEAISYGVKICGENRVQEAKEKIEEIGHSVSWHLVGHLQGNKVKYIFDLFDLIHSVDTLPLAREISKSAQKRGRTIDILIQINLSGEGSKHGVKGEKTLDLIKEISLLQNISIRGLMTIPPLSEDPEDSRIYYRELMDKKREIEREVIEGVVMKEISMGMSSDFEVAIEEGATLVRVGTAIFGERQNKIKIKD
ncbi:MAG: YggS family pyridoxal phosphate-dependent enzyme [Nitrospinae bacterium]|nr:YggS family pyridoxal phosphate-dependent enzyme [Nitrospinota bacterium]